MIHLWWFQSDMFVGLRMRIGEYHVIRYPTWSVTLMPQTHSGKCRNLCLVAIAISWTNDLRKNSICWKTITWESLSRYTIVVLKKKMFLLFITCSLTVKFKNWVTFFQHTFCFLSTLKRKNTYKYLYKWFTSQVFHLSINSKERQRSSETSQIAYNSCITLWNWPHRG